MPKQTREAGRFVTLQSKRVIFIPKGHKSKWADVKDKVKASQKKKTSLSELAGVKPISSVPSKGAGGEAYIDDYGEHGKVFRKISKYGSAESEVLTYEFSESIGWDIVPETIMPEGSKSVSVQRWVKGKTEEDLPLEKTPTRDSRIVMMDALLSNTDRNPGNIVIDGKGRQWAIDNDMSFAVWKGEYSYRPSDWLTSVGAVPREHAGLIDAAKDIARWRGTPDYERYVSRVRELIGSDVAATFEKNVRLASAWADVARAVDYELEPHELPVGLDGELM